MANRIGTLGWSQDPTGVHQLRYHDGVGYTQCVVDDGVVGVDMAPIALSRPSAPVVGEVLPPILVEPPAASPTDAPLLPAPQPAPEGAPRAVGNGIVAGDAVAPGSAEPARKHRRVGFWLAIAVAVLETVVIAAFGLGPIGTHTTHPKHSSTAKPIGSTVAPSGSFGEFAGSVLFSSNFAANAGWDTGSLNTNTTAAVWNGLYIVNGWTLIHHVLLTPYEIPQRGISVETSAANYPTGNVSFGTGCQSASGISPALVYQMLVYPDGQWFIEEGRMPGRVETLLSGQTTALGSAASTQLTCVLTTSNADAQTTQLVGYVNGIQVGAIGDRIDGVSVGGYVPLLVLGSFGPKVAAAFTHVTVRSITPPEQPELQVQLWPRGASH